MPQSSHPSQHPLLRHLVPALIAAALFLALPSQTQAQDGLSATVTSAPTGTEAAAAPSAGADISDSQREAALEMIEIMGMNDTLDLSMRQMIDVQVQRNPQLAPMRDVLEDFFETYLSWGQLKNEFVALYARTFSETEMREITAFYRTPTGQKMLEALPGLIAETNGIGMSRVQAHYGELQQALAERQQQLQAEAAAAANAAASAAAEAEMSQPDGSSVEESSSEDETPPN